MDFYINSYDPNAVLPLAFECASYDDFIRGKCADCGKSGEKCVVLGPKAVWYKEVIDKREKRDEEGEEEKLEGKRFFLDTKAHEPLLNSKSDILSLTFSSSSLNLINRTSIHRKVAHPRQDS